MMELDKEWYTTFEVARMLGVAGTTVTRWCREGKIKAVRTLGGHYRIHRQEVERLLKLLRGSDYEQ